VNGEEQGYAMHYSLFTIHYSLFTIHQSPSQAMTIDDYLNRWKLVADGDPISTPTSTLLPVRRGAEPAMLKIARLDEERRGNALMIWWDGHGAARILAHDDDAILMERAESGSSVADVARQIGDGAASRLIASVLAKLHAPRGLPAPTLPPLAEWFEPLARAAAEGGLFPIAATTAASLLATQRDIVVLHGDMHHHNVLDFGTRGWLAIDPKGLLGERGFDYANLFCNPDAETATRPGRLTRQAQVVAEAAHLDRTRLISWIVAWAGLSAAFSLDDGLDPAHSLRIAELALRELDR
jgi:streptomycin 6-kinase